MIHRQMNKGPSNSALLAGNGISYGIKGTENASLKPIISVNICTLFSVHQYCAEG